MSTSPNSPARPARTVVNVEFIPGMTMTAEELGQAPTDSPERRAYAALAHLAAVLDVEETADTVAGLFKDLGQVLPGHRVYGAALSLAALDADDEPKVTSIFEVRRFDWLSNTPEWRVCSVHTSREEAEAAKARTHREHLFAKVILVRVKTTTETTIL